MAFYSSPVNKMNHAYGKELIIVRNDWFFTFFLVNTFIFPSCVWFSAPSQDLVKSLALLESVFMSSYPNGEGTLPTPRPGGPGLHGAALQAWSLLVTLCPSSKVSVLLDQWVK